jgi:RND family efflux transporter MFP subunit
VVQNGSPTEEVLTVAQQEFVQSVSVSGKVEAVKDVDLGFAQGGRVGRVLATVGSRVEQGSVLAETENGDIVALVQQREASLQVAEAELASLLVGTRKEEIAVAEADVRAKNIALEQAALSLIDEVQDAYTTADNAIKTKVDQFFSNASGLTPQLSFSVSNSNTKNIVESGRRDMGTLLSTWEPHVAGVTAPTVSESVSEAKANLGSVSVFLMHANNAVSQGLTGGSVTQTTLNGYGTDIGVARTSINTAISSLTVAETAWLSAATALASAEKNLSLKKAGATAQDLAAQQARVKSAKASVLDAEAQLRKTRIIAPFAGTITEVSVKVGEVAQSNTPVISIITASDLLVESYVPETNVALLAVDDTAEITLDAYGGDAVFAARVASIDPAETVRDGISTYRTLLTFEQADARIRPGMTANISIVADKRDNVISVPQKIITIREGKKLVKVKRGDIFEDREVTTGAVSSVGTIEILSGLSVGDVVLLSEKK